MDAPDAYDYDYAYEFPEAESQQRKRKMSKVSGTISAVSRNGKGICIGDTWYNAYKAAQINGASKGDAVEFQVKEVEKGGTTFRNIEGDVRVVGSGNGGSSARNSSAGGGSRGNGSGGDSDKMTKEEWAKKDRMIVRQNALTQANALFRTMVGDSGQEGPAEQEVDTIIEMAKLFEAYVTGE